MTPVHASALSILLRAALVTVAPSPSDYCPSSAQAQASLASHAPHLLSSDAKTSPLTLVLPPPLPSGETSFFLVDASGMVRLYRTLVPVPPDRPKDCAALADTVAFIVARYFEELDMPTLPDRPRPPPPPAPPPPPTFRPPVDLRPLRASVAGSVGRRVPGGFEDLGGIEFRLLADIGLWRLGQRGARLWLSTSAGLVGIAERELRRGEDRAKATRAVAEMGILAGWPIGGHHVLVGPTASMELLWLEATLGSRHQDDFRTAAAAGLRLSYRYHLRRWFFLRADVGGYAALVRHEIVTASDPSFVAFSSPALYLTSAVGLGFAF